LIATLSKEDKMLALRGMVEAGKIELFDPPPQGTRSLVAVVFLDAGPISSLTPKKRCSWRIHQPLSV